MNRAKFTINLIAGALLPLTVCGTALAQSIPVEPINPTRITPEQARQTQGITPPPSSNVGDVYQEKFSQHAPIIPDSFIDKVAKTWRPTQEFNVKPKDSIMIAVGQGLMNTISTNLTMLTAKTNDEHSSFEIDQGYLYVTVSSTNPISLVLYEEGVLDSQISVTLVPVPAPPTIAKLNFDLTPKMKADSEAFQKKLQLEEAMAQEQPDQKGNNPHTAKLIEILRPVAQGEIPRGFGMTPDIPDSLRHPCMMTIYHRAEQRMVSGNHIIDVILAKNDTDKPYNVREEMCITKGTLAVALFEKAYLQPGEASELYIVRDKQLEMAEKRIQRRPRLVGGN